MTRACIVTIDAARARIFLYNGQAKPGFELVEYKDLDHPGRRLSTGVTVSDQPLEPAQHGPGRGPRGGGEHLPFGETSAANDDRRDVPMTDTKFASHVFEMLEVILREKQIPHLVVCAAPRMMGVVRAEGDSVLRRPELKVNEVTSNLSTLTEAALHDHLSDLGLIPPRARLAMAR